MRAHNITTITRPRRKARRRALVIGVAAIGVLLAGCTDDTQGDTKTLSYTELTEREFSAPIGKASPPGVPGNGFTYATPLLDSSGKAVGEFSLICITTQPKGQEAQCNGTADVPGGQLALDVGGSLAKITGAIVGGTGDYTGATGTFTSEGTGKREPKDTFNVTLP